jgi:hypothetical protein
MDIGLPEAKTYDPPGHCIYCGLKAADTQLSREHIIPKGLGGLLIFRKASCSDCAEKTKRVEGICQRFMWIDTRTHLSMPSYRPKERPTKLRVGKFRAQQAGVAFPDLTNVEFNWESVPVSEHPFVFVLPRIYPPAVLWGTDTMDCFTVYGMQAHINETTRARLQALKQRAKEGLEDTMVFQPFDASAFARLLAKTAHGAAVAELGYGSFEPVLPPPYSRTN